jgi:two-component system, cell cycle sensor histidine kinase and response regulator CckA
MAKKPSYEELEQKDQVALTPWRMYLLICVVGLMITGILGYGFFKGDRMNKEYAPLIDAAMEIKLEATTAHLWFEEIISGDRHEDINSAWKHQDQAEWYAQAMLEGGKNQEGIFIPLDDPEMRRKIKDVQGKLKEFREITQERIKAKGTSGIGTDIDQRYDHVFRSFLKEADEVETRLQQIMAKDLSDFRYIQVFLIVISILLLFLAIGISFWYFDNQRVKNLLLLNKANRALRKSEERYRSLVENQTDLVSRFTPDGRFVFVNDACCRFFEKTKDELIGQKWQPLPINDDLPVVQEKLHTLSPSNPTVLIENRVFSSKGDIHWMQFVNSGSFDLHGNLVEIQSVGRDITERKWAEEELLKERTLLKTIIDNIPVMLTHYNPDAKMMYLNKEFEKIVGWKTEEVRDIDMMEKVYPDPDYRQQAIEYMQQASTKWREFRVQSKSGKIIDSEWSNICMEDGTQIGIGMDITERKQAEETLRESEEKYRSMMEAMKDPIYICSPDFRVEYMNPAMIRRTGRDAIGESCFKALHDLNKKCSWCVHDKVQQGEYIELEIVSPKDNLSYHILQTPVVHGDGSISKLTVFRDITEIRETQVQLQQAQKMESIGTLAGGIAHNFNNLLMGIQGNASMALLDIDSSNPRHKNLTNIEKLVENGAKLTAQLIGYAREGSYEVKPTSLNQLVKETSDTFGMTKKEITVHQELSEKLYGIKADQGQIEQVLLNLYVNAADAMPEGGDLFLKTINATDKDITGKLYKVQPGNYVFLSVRDTGGGMDKETRERIFEPFFTTKGLASGTGLGMASAYGIIKGHGGYIDVDSEVGKGATFSIYLPATEKVIEEKKILSDELVKGKGTVLLVDDEEMVLDVGKELLNHLGYEVLLAENGQEALELYKKNQDEIDLVLLDMVMPVMGGGEAFDRMKEINTNVKVLLSSGYSLEGEAKEILKRGCDAFIQKPFKMEQLSQKLRGILDKK